MPENNRTFLFCIGSKYYVTHGFGDDICDIFFNSDAEHNVFEVDELIAEQLAMLCNKGYITKHSCSGHPSGTCSYTIKEDANAQKAVIPEEHVAVTQFEEGAMAVCDLEKCLDGEVYIAFQEAYRFDSIPDGWTYDDGVTLRAKIQATSTIDFFRKVLSAAETLSNWINTLTQN